MRVCILSHSIQPHQQRSHTFSFVLVLVLVLVLLVDLYIVVAIIVVVVVSASSPPFCSPRVGKPLKEVHSADPNTMPF